ncbi:MAG: hypothetical protein U0Z53_09940 [Blastocatellia bacterium]
MEKINWSRVLLGGLLAGLVMNTGEFVLNGVLFTKEIEEATRKLSLPAPGGDFIAKAVVMMFIVGIIAVFIYAAIRPRFGAGPKTGIVAGLLVWLLAFVYPALMNTMMGIFPLRLTVIGLVWGLVEVTVATVTGAWLYRDAVALTAAYREKRA